MDKTEDEKLKIMSKVLSESQAKYIQFLIHSLFTSCGDVFKLMSEQKINEILKMIETRKRVLEEKGSKVCCGYFLDVSPEEDGERVCPVCKTRKTNVILCHGCRSFIFHEASSRKEMILGFISQLYIPESDEKYQQLVQILNSL